jgi:hypothetical protein
LSRLPSHIKHGQSGQQPSSAALKGITKMGTNIPAIETNVSTMEIDAVGAETKTALRDLTGNVCTIRLFQSTPGFSIYLCTLATLAV